MAAEIQILTRSNQTTFANVYCDACKWDWRDVSDRDLSVDEAKDLADFHNECEHA